MKAEDQAALEFVRTRVAADAATAHPLDADELLRFDLEDGELISVAFDGESSFPLDLEDGVEATCRLVLDQVQDCVTGRQHRPWPELRHGDGRFVGVLDPGEQAGLACWLLRGVPFCAVGQLAGAVRAAGLRVA
jgi:hypothetical protein